MDTLDDEFLLFFSCAQKNKLRYMIIGGYAVNYYGYNRNTDDLNIWIAPANENKLAFIQTLLCMNYSETEVAPFYQEDEIMPGIFINLTPYDFLINMKSLSRRDKDLWDIAGLDEFKNKK